MPTKEKKTNALPQGWVTTEHKNGSLSAVKHFGTSELQAYGRDEQELLTAVEDYEDRIERGLIVPR